MTTESSTASPYQVFVEVPVYVHDVISGRRIFTYVNTGLRPGQLEDYDLYGSKVKFILAAFLSSHMVWAFGIVLFAITLLPALVNGDSAGLATVGGVALLWISATVWATRYLRRLRKAVGNAVEEMKKQGAIASIPHDGEFRDLRRISHALHHLQAKHGTRYDDQAQEAAAAVILQDRHKPTQKHMTIAESDASDATSVDIRKKTVEALAAWRRDVAQAEQLILALEEAARSETKARV